MRLAHADLLQLGRVPGVDVLERDNSWKDIAKRRLDVFPAALPVLARARLLLLPRLRRLEAMEGLAETAEWIHARRRRAHARGFAGAVRIPACIPFFSEVPGSRAILAAGDDAKACGLHLFGRDPRSRLLRLRLLAFAAAPLLSGNERAPGIGAVIGHAESGDGNGHPAALTEDGGDAGLAHATSS